jgi:hypothetical protein
MKEQHTSSFSDDQYEKTYSDRVIITSGLPQEI